MLLVLCLIILILLAIICWSVRVSKGRKTEVRFTPKDYQLQAKTISLLTSDNVTLESWFIKSSHSPNTIILVHGFGMNKGEVLKRTHFLAKYYNLLYLDCRGAGESSGRSEAGLQESKDVCAAVDYLRKTYPNLSQKIALYGISMGAAAASYYTATYGGITCLVLESSYYSFKNVAKRWMWKHAKVPYFPLVASMISWKEYRMGQKVETFALQQTAAKITCPVLMIQGGEDELAPVEKAQKTYNLLPGPKELWIVPQAGHLSCYKIDETAYSNKITHFFQEYL